MKKFLFLGIVAALLLIPFMAFATTGHGTETNTPITALGAANTLNYTDTSNSSKPQVTSITDLVTTVTSEYGLDPLALLGDQGINPADTAAYSYVVSNEGNAPDAYTMSFTISFEGFTSTAGLNWFISIESGATALMMLDKDKLTGVATTTSIAEDGVYAIKITVDPSNESVHSPDGAQVLVTFNVFTVQKPVGEYTGANAVEYGGLASSSDATVTSISTSKMTMTRTATVDAPIKYVANGGKVHDAVPGSVITYTIVVSSEGSKAAQKAIIIDKNPDAQTAPFHVGAGKGFQTGITNVTIEAVSPDATGWTAYYTIGSPTGAELNYGYIGTTWITVGAWPTNIYVLSSAITYVKFEKLTVETTEDLKKITWGVVIK